MRPFTIAALCAATLILTVAPVARADDDDDDEDVPQPVSRTVVEPPHNLNFSAEISCCRACLAAVS